MTFARHRRSLTLLVLAATPLLASFLTPPMLSGADDGGKKRDGERAVTLTLKALGGDRAEGPPVYAQLQPIRIEYKLKLGKFSGIDHIFYFHATEMTNHGQMKVSKEGVAVSATLHSASDRAQIMSDFAKRLRLEPGETFTGVLIVNLFHDMTAEGNYRIDMSSVYQDDFIENSIKVEAEPITVKVKGYPL